MEFCDTDLSEVIGATRAAGGDPIPAAAIKDLMHQLLSGMRAVHEAGTSPEIVVQPPRQASSMTHALWLQPSRLSLHC